MNGLIDGAVLFQLAFILGGIVFLALGFSIFYSKKVRKFAANFYYNYLETEQDREKQVLTWRAPILIMVGVLLISIPLSSLTPEPEALVFEQRCEWYKTFTKEAEIIPLRELSATLDSLTRDAGSSGKAWAKYSAYFHEFNRRNGMFDSTEWDDCPK